jgi:hypothetical protein
LKKSCRALRKAGENRGVEDHPATRAIGLVIGDESAQGRLHRAACAEAARLASAPGPRPAGLGGSSHISPAPNLTL